MIKNRCLCLFFICALSNRSITPSDKQEQIFNHAFTFAGQKQTAPQKTVGQLAHELEPFNTVKIKDYQWTTDQDHVYTESHISKEQRSTVAAIFKQLIKHRDNKIPLSLITTDEQALSIKEGFFNGLCNPPHTGYEEIKLGYDFMNGTGKFFERHGNYKKSAQLSAAHNFAMKVWPHLDHNHVTITELVTMSQDSIETTDTAWLALKAQIESDSSKRFSKPTDKK